MTPFNRRHPKQPGYSPTSISLANDLLLKHPNTTLGLLANILDLHPQLVGNDISDTAERISRYAARSLAREASDRLTTSENQDDKSVLHHYLNQY